MRQLLKIELDHAVMLLRYRDLTIAALLMMGSQHPATANESLVTYQSLSPDAGLELAQAALKRCRSDGYQVAVVVIDRFGQRLVLLRDQFAGPPAADTAYDKAYTSLTFRSSTSELIKSVESGQVSAGLGNLPHVRFLAGGLKIEAAGALVGAVGVSGASGGEKDEACAAAGLAAIQDKLEF